MNQALYSAYVKILEEELVPAMGCTEPIAVAYAAALARKALGEMPQSVEVHVSANIIKNVKSVVVPHTGGLRGIGAAVAAGIVAGDADRELEVLSAVTEEQVEAMAAYLKDTPISIAASDNGYIFDIQIRANAGEHTAFVQIAGLVARRIICHLKPGQTVTAGERYGLIRFGSRVDVFLPEGYAPQVVKGQRAVAGETVIARLGETTAATGIFQ